MDFAYQLLKGEFDSIIPLSYIFWGIGFAATISILCSFTAHSEVKRESIETEEPKFIDVGLCEERIKNVL